MELQPQDVPQVAELRREAQHGVLGRGTTPPRTLTAPLGGGGRQPCNGLRVVLPPVRKSPVSRAAAVLSRRAALAGRFADTGVRARRAKVHDSGAVVHSADVPRVRARLSERRARCLRAPASLLCECVGCRCDVQCGVMRVDALGVVPPVQSW